MQKYIQYISHLRFTSDPRLYNWDKRIERDFWKENNIRYMKADDVK